MSTLVIIGNGFDIWNSLPTNYWYFYEKYNRSLEDHIQYFDDFYCEDTEWANFEESLGSFNHDNFHDNAAMQPSIEEMADDNTLLYGFEDEISIKRDELVDDITTAFKQWISSVDVSTAEKLIELPSDLKFVTFNYTTTLQDVYGISEENILHIHGKVRANIIFGHGRGASSHINSEESDEPWFEESLRSASSVSEVFHKPVDKILERNRTQLEGYGPITEIFVIGHSVNDIDLPYFQCILNAYPDAEWKNFNYIDLDNDIDAVTATHNKLIRAGVPEDKLTSSSSEHLKTIFSLV
ncbi:bacteriophage abortive infection AbiH family protein [Pseudoalteromonas sp. 2CM39R]|uniref:bacteriophage abortive infection AbiH family protein n=1 Tax=Pseudoalteromonas sp. 2CM39R TaxID=2929856 RepID=UPI0020C09EDB|nr:bacteriophage abortive infection AbiH family protein [Pseudoalteromonas sp. 2CM39R]MCK8125873.1 bacteriophage abortive infection AbiH family protein [Pseudoalteromonas sp. 2CM39R]